MIETEPNPVDWNGRIGTWLLAMAVLVVACGEKELGPKTNVAADPFPADPCVGSYTPPDTECTIGTSNFVLEIDAVSGMPAEGIVPRTADCGGGTGNLRSVYSDLTGEWPTECAFQWKFVLEVNDGDVATDLTPVAWTSDFENPRPGEVAMVFETEPGSVCRGSVNFHATGSGEVRVERVKHANSNDRYCGIFTLDEVEFAPLVGPEEAFVVSGQIRGRNFEF